MTGGTAQVFERLSEHVWDLLFSVPPVLCKRKVEACWFLSVQKFVSFVGTLVNGV